ncbi:MAG: ribonuclease BN [Bacteroidetes bacterium]|nr:MAG: ribonuclease BN [Bacteroidota bacterium]
MKLFNHIKSYFVSFKKAFGLFIDYNGLKLSAALSYYTVFSIAPFLIVIISLAGIFLGRQAVEGEVYGEMRGLVGSDAAIQVQQIIQNIQESKHSTIGGIIGFVVLIVGASGVFSEIQSSINYIWSINQTSKKGILVLIIKKLISFSLLISMAFVLMVSLIVNALIDILSNRLRNYFDDSTVKIFYGVNVLLIFIIITLLFTLIFKVLPNAIIRWRDAITGAVVTAVLFLLGKFLIGFYLGNSRIGLMYGTTASIVIIMLWVYYSSIILYFGACFTKIYAKEYGNEIIAG